MKEIELSDGTIEYEDTGGDGPVLVLLHGLMMDASLWDGVIAGLSADHRCVAPTLPLGAHRRAMRADADLSLPGIARLAAEFLDRLDLQDVTLVGNDTGGALVQLLMGDGAARLTRAVLVSCDAFDNFPPGLTGKTLVLSGKLPPTVFGLFMQQMRLRAVRRLPIAFGWLTMRGDAATARWMKPVLTRPEIRRDTVRVLRAAAADTGLLLEAADRLPGFNHPALIVWASRDRVMPPEHGQRLAKLLPHGQLVEVDDSYTLIPLDQPARLAQIIREFTPGSTDRFGSDRYTSLFWAADAENEFRHLFAARQRTLGPDHPDTLIARFSIAQEMAARGYHTGAEHEFRDMLPHLEQRLGPDHPDTLAAAEWIDYIQGKKDHRQPPVGP